MKNLLTVICCAASLTAGAQHTLVKDINWGPDGSNPVAFSICNNKLYFIAETDSFGDELWMHDGTSTAMVADIYSSSAALSHLSQTCAMGNDLYFRANDGIHNAELWKYDGVTPPAMVANISTDPGGSYPLYMNTMGGKLYFYAASMSSGYEPRSYDPATGMVTLLRDIAPGNVASFGTMSCVFNGKLYFGAVESSVFELWVHDPVANTTTKVGSGTSIAQTPNLTVIDNKLYFVGTSSTNGHELYVYDGVNAPQRLSDLAAGPANGMFGSAYSVIMKYKNLVYFGGDPANGAGIATYDPTTSTVAPAFTTPFNSAPAANLCLYAGKLYYTGAETGSGKGMELYRYNGTGSPQLAADIMPGADSSFPGYPIVYANHLYFSAEAPGMGRELFKFYDSDVTASVGSVVFTALVNIFPNPATKNFSLDMNLEQPAKFAVQLYDMAGRKVYDGGMHSYETGKQQLSISAEALTPGNYNLQLRTAGGETFYTTQLVKQ